MPDSFVREKRTVFLLTAAQALFQTALVMVVTLAALVGLQLAPDARLATLPNTMMVIASAAMMIPAALLMQRYGRRAGFLLGTALGCAAGLMAAWAIWRQSFWLFTLAILLVGGYQACAQYYRFAAADAVSTEFRSRAISWVMSGGVVAALAGPNLVRMTQDFGPMPFVVSYIVFFALSLSALVVVTRIPFLPMSPPKETGAAHAPSRSLREIIRQPVFLTALISSSVGYAVMVMVMTATPLAMHLHGHPLDDSATVIQWHMLGMFVPSFFTGSLIRRYGVLTIIGIGIALLLGEVGVALSGIAFPHFLFGLMLLGIGWNFLFVGGTTLLTEAYRPSERARTQAAHDFLMFGATSLASFSSGALISSWGWRAVNFTALPFLLLALLAVSGLALARRRMSASTTATPPRAKNR